MSINQQRRLLCYNGEVLIFKLSKKKVSDEMHAETCILYVRKMVFDIEINTFTLKSSGFFPMQNEGSHLKIICCNSVSDFRTGINLPYVLMQNKQLDNVFEYCLIFLHGNNKFEKCLSFTLGYEMNDSIRVLNGPLLLWQYVKTVYCISSQIGKVITVSNSFSSVLWAGEIQNLGLVMLGLMEYAGKTLEPEYNVCNSKFCMYSLQSQKVLSDTHIIHPAYSNVVTYIHICKTEIVNNQLRMSLIALTRVNQLILFHNGMPKIVCQLPFEGPCTVQPVIASEGKLFFIVSFRSNQVCAVSEKDFQITAKWEKFSLALVDDFLGNGREQVLLLFKDSWNSDYLASFELTDMSTINYSVSSVYFLYVTLRSILENSEPVKYDEDSFEEHCDNRCLVIPPLRNCILMFLGFIQQFKNLILLKEKFILKYWKALINLTQDESTPNIEEVSFVPLFGEEEEEEEEEEVEEKEEEEKEDKEESVDIDEKLPDVFKYSEQEIEKIWYRVLDDSLIVGVKITSSLNVSQNDVTLSLLIDKNYNHLCPLLKCQNKVIRLTSFSAPYLKPHEVGSEAKTISEAKRIKLTHEEEESFIGEQPSKKEYKQIIAGVTSFPPLLLLKKFSCIVLLQTKERKNGKCPENRLFSCGRLCISFEDLSTGQFLLTFPDKKQTEHIEDLSALLAVLNKNCFHVTSSVTALNVMQMWLIDYLNCDIIERFPEICFCNEPGGVYGTLFKWKQRTPFEGILTVYSRNKTVLFQCLHNLIERLPMKCYFRNLKSGSEDLPVDHSALTLEEALVTPASFSTLTLHNFESNNVKKCEASKEKCSTVTTSSETEDINHLYRNNMREKMLEMNLQVSGSLYGETTLELSEIQLSSDLFAQKMTHFSLT
ncbi:LOW QUALITY PROTEIN: Fanconi anemia group B protein [Thomomys bottae]